MLCLIVDADAWMVPETGETETKGDVNLDGSVTMGDMVLLLRHLLGELHDRHVGVLGRHR